MLPLICLLVLLGQGYASPQANQYVETVLYTSLQNVIRNEKLDPTFLPDYTYEYTDKTWMGKVHGKAEYTEGKLEGLSKVSRYAECQGPANITTGTYINCTLSFTNLHTNYKGKVKYGVIPKVSITPKGDIQNTLIDVSIFKGKNERNPTVKKFGFRRVGTMNTHFTGLGPLNKQLGNLEQNYKERVTAEVTNVLNNRFSYALNLALITVPMPLH